MENRMKKLSVILTILMGFTSYAVTDTVEDHKKACQSQDAKGCFSLGLAYTKGIEIERDYELAKDFLGIACDLGNVQACLEIKNMDQNHNSSKIDTSETEEDKGFMGDREACDRGDGFACWYFGYLYDEGKKVKRNYAKAGKYYKKACDLGNGLGCFNMGFLYEEGKGVKRNNSKAVEYYKKSCNLANGTGCFLLGLLYETGKGVEHNNTKAKEYYKKACDLGDKGGCAEYRKMRSD